jgi:hypothetical protein
MGRALADASAAFVGTVTATSNGDRWATVAVSDVWKGDVDAEVEVRGGPEDPPGPLNASSSVERTFDEGQTYLFLPFGGRGDVFHDNACSRTTVYRDSLERLRPPGAEPPEPEAPPAPPEPPREGTSVAWWGAAAALAAVAGTWAWRKRVGPTSPPNEP